LANLRTVSVGVKKKRPERAAMAITPGRREVNKRAKAERIRAAATSLFHSRGYRETTMKMIASAANVAPGTLFLYAADKRDLLLMIINDELDVLTAHAFSGVDRRAPLLDQLMHLFKARYQYWGVDPELSLRALQEVLLPQTGDDHPSSQFTRYQQRREVLIANIFELIVEQQRAGNVRADQDPVMLADLCMAIHLSVVRTWLRNFSPSMEAGIARLRALLALALHGSLVDPRG
jgi:AcrR family transcriptional regulator